MYFEKLLWMYYKLSQIVKTSCINMLFGLRKRNNFINKELENYLKAVKMFIKLLLQFSI